MEAPEVELETLKNALLAHLEWQSETGAIGLPPCDATTLELRRERYRETMREPLAENESSSPGTTWDREADQTESDEAQRTPTRPEYDHSVAEPAEPATAAASDRVVAGVMAREREAPTHAAEAASRPAQALNPVAPGASRPEAPAPSPSTGHRLVEDARHRLLLLQDEVSGCTRCGLHETRTNTVFARGSERSGICFVGEGPGADEDVQGLPFVGPAGQLLDKMIQAMGFDRDDVYVCNIVKCRPPKNRKPEPTEMAACREFLTEQIELLQPKVIVALGATAVTGLLGLSLGITRLRGQWRLYRGQIPVMPTFHPAYLLRQPSAKRQVWDDLKQVLNHLGLDAPPR